MKRFLSSDKITISMCPLKHRRPTVVPFFTALSRDNVAKLCQPVSYTIPIICRHCVEIAPTCTVLITYTRNTRPYTDTVCRIAHRFSCRIAPAHLRMCIARSTSWNNYTQQLGLGNFKENP